MPNPNPNADPTAFIKITYNNLIEGGKKGFFSTGGLLASSCFGYVFMLYSISTIHFHHPNNNISTLQQNRAWVRGRVSRQWIVVGFGSVYCIAENVSGEAEPGYPL